jgi:intracellular sulfur oxidation DsrE/DsrF family protein
MTASNPDRRAALRRFSAVVAGLGVAPALAAAESVGVSAPVAIDERWLDAMTGSWKQIFDITAPNGGAPFGGVRNFLNAYRDAYQLPAADVNALVILHGGAAPIGFSHEGWAKFGFGEAMSIKDGDAAAKRNVFLDGTVPAPDANLTVLRDRGVRFALCNNSLTRVVGEVAQRLGREPVSVRPEIEAQILPFVTVVPAAMVLLNRAQKRGFSYVKM